MPTLVKSIVTSYTVPKGTHMYLSNECSESQNTAELCYAPGSDGRHVFESARDLYFSEKELVGCNGSIALFLLSDSEWHIAKYIVVGARDVVVNYGHFDRRPSSIAKGEDMKFRIKPFEDCNSEELPF